MIKYEIYFYLRAGNDYWIAESSFYHTKSIVAGDFIKIDSGEKLEVKEVSISPSSDQVAYLRLETLPVPPSSVAFYEGELSQAGMSISKVGKP